MEIKPSACCVEPPAGPKRWFRKFSVLAALGLAGLIAVSHAVPALTPFRASALSYFRMIWWAVLLGFFLGGLLERYIPRAYVSKLLAGKRKRSVVFAVLLGFLMSTCSHGILALAVELYKKGASTAVVVAFLLASPWANLPITLLLFGFFGVKALFIILGALGIALTTGFAFRGLERRGWVERNPRTLPVEEGFSIRRDLLARARRFRLDAKRVQSDAAAIFRGALSLADGVLGWILIGVALSSLAAAFIPAGFFHSYMSATPVGLLVTLGVATVVEVCSEGTSPLAFEIYRQTGAFGNAFVFLMAGVVTDYTEIGLLWSNVGRRTALWLPVIAVPQVVLLGYVANRLFR